MNTHDNDIELPPLVGTLASLPERHREVIEAYGQACARVAAEAALQSQDREDAERLQAMASEWDRARRGGDYRMPIWFALCDAIGSDADGAGMRAAIDHARRIEGGNHE